MMNERGKSDRSVVPGKLPNKAEEPAAEEPPAEEPPPEEPPAEEAASPDDAPAAEEAAEGEGAGEEPPPEEEEPPPAGLKGRLAQLPIRDVRSMIPLVFMGVFALLSVVLIVALIVGA